MDVREKIKYFQNDFLFLLFTLVNVTRESIYRNSVYIKFYSVG